MSEGPNEDGIFFPNSGSCIMKAKNQAFQVVGGGLKIEHCTEAQMVLKVLLLTHFF